MKYRKGVKIVVYCSVKIVLYCSMQNCRAQLPHVICDVNGIPEVKPVSGISHISRIG
jgi:hypothetical protein